MCRYAAPVAALAEGMGLPRALVDLRHEATHKELPSLLTLRHAAHAALQWLRQSYWERQADALVAARSNVTALLVECADMLIGNTAAAAAAAAAVEFRCVGQGFERTWAPAAPSADLTHAPQRTEVYVRVVMTNARHAGECCFHATRVIRPELIPHRTQPTHTRTHPPFPALKLNRALGASVCVCVSVCV